MVVVSVRDHPTAGSGGREPRTRKRDKVGWTSGKISRTTIKLTVEPRRETKKSRRRCHETDASLFIGSTLISYFCAPVSGFPPLSCFNLDPKGSLEVFSGIWSSGFWSYFTIPFYDISEINFVRIMFEIIRVSEAEIGNRQMWDFGSWRIWELNNFKDLKCQELSSEIWKLKKSQSRCNVSNSDITCSPNSSIDRSNFRRRYFAWWSVFSSAYLNTQAERVHHRASDNYIRWNRDQ